LKVLIMPILTQNDINKTFDQLKTCEII
jgi:hypothetical protein